MTHTTSKTAVRRLAAARLISITGGADQNNYSLANTTASATA